MLPASTVLHARLAISTLLLALGMCAGAQADDWSLTRPRSGGAQRSRPARVAPSERKDAPADRRNVLIERYLAELWSEPAQDAAFERLLGLVRERDGGLVGLLDRLAASSAQASDGAKRLWLLARVLHAAGRNEEARHAFAQASAAAPTDAGPLRGWAALEREAGDLSRARELLEEAASRAHPKARAALRQELGELAIETGDYEAAQAHFGAAARGAGGGEFQALQFARALAAHGAHARAVLAYRDAIARQHGDPRALPGILLELARAQEEAGDVEGALASLWSVRDRAANPSGERHAAHEALLTVHRQAGRLDALIARLANSPAADADALELLGQAHEELGQFDAALAAYRRLLARAPAHLDARQRVIRLLTRQARLDEVVDEYRALVRHAPRESRFVVEFAELLMQTGRRDEALAVLARATRAHPRDAALQRAAHRLYSRWGEPELAERALLALVRLEPDEPAHLVALGEQQMQRGDAAAAEVTWKRVVPAAPDKGHGYAMLGDIYLDHDRVAEALEALERASRALPDDPAVAKSYAEALERNRNFADALSVWASLLRLPAADATQRREARRRIVQIWEQIGALHARAVELEAAARADPPRAANVEGAVDAIESMRLLVQVYERTGRTARRGAGAGDGLREAERIALKITEAEPGDVESLEMLERLRVARGDLDGAIAVLESLLQADPRRSKDYLSRMARHALALYRDDAALGFAERAAALDPADAEAQRRLGDLYRAAQRVDDAIESYRRAALADPQQFGVQLEVAGLLIARGDIREAANALRSVIRGSLDDDLVARAARTVMPLPLAPADRLSMEQELLSLSLGRTARPVYRRLLVEHYDARVQGLSQQATAGDAEAAAGLRHIAQQGLKPLLEALLDPAAEQRRAAVRVLSGIGAEAALAALFAMVNADPDPQLRRQALDVIVRGAGKPHTERLIALLDAPERRVRESAMAALARLADPGQAELFLGLLDNGLPPLRGYAALGLGRARVQRAGKAIAQRLQVDRVEWVRGSAALALGQLGPDAVDALVEALETDVPTVAAAAALALGALGDPRAIVPLARAVFRAEPRFRSAALCALHILERARAGAASVDIDPPEHADLALLLDRIVMANATSLGDELGHEVEEALALAARQALSEGPPETVQGVLDVWSPAHSGVRSDASGWQGGLSSEQRARLARRVVAELSAVLAHPDAVLRRRALGVLAAVESAEATAAIVGALNDPDAQVQALALEQIRPRPDLPHEALRDRLIELAHGERAWWTRRRVVEALGRLGGERAQQFLIEALATDAYAYVREAAAAALATQHHAAARDALARSMAEDAEATVRLAAARALRTMGDPAARRLLEAAPPEIRAALQKDPGTSDSAAVVPH